MDDVEPVSEAASTTHGYPQIIEGLRVQTCTDVKLHSFYAVFTFVCLWLRKCSHELKLKSGLKINLNLVNSDITEWSLYKGIHGSILVTADESLLYGAMP